MGPTSVFLPHPRSPKSHCAYMLSHGSLSPGPPIQPTLIRETLLSGVHDTVFDRILLRKFDWGAKGLNSEGLSRPISLARRRRAHNDGRMLCHHCGRLLQLPRFNKLRLSLSPHYPGPDHAGMVGVPPCRGTPANLAFSFSSPAARTCPARVLEDSQHPDSF